MQDRQYLPIISTIIISLIGIIILVSIYNYWQQQEVSINNPIISNVKKESQTLDLKTIIHEAEKNVMQIEGQNEFSTITGSGFLYNEKGDIITNAHVIQDADVIYVRTANARIYPAAVVGIGEELDIAVIRVPQLAGQNGLSIERDSYSEIGDEVIALGSPHGFQNTVTLGIISGTERNFSVDGFNYKNAYQISAQITHGNSGGPLINRETGKIIGINSVGTEDGTIGFSIPITEVISEVEQWSKEAQNDQLDFSSITDILNKHDPEQFTKDAEYVIEYFLDSLVIRDYVNAYALLGDSMQSELSYPEFRERYIQIVDLKFADFTSEVLEDNQLQTTVNITIEKKLKNEEETTTERSEHIFTVGFENDQLKILKLVNP